MSDGHLSALLETMIEAGGVAADYHGRPSVRHFSDPQSEYLAAEGGLAVFDRSHRTRLAVSGKAPGQMLNGILTGRIPGPATVNEEGVALGEATYHAVLTPKGKMVTDLWGLLPGEEASPGFLLDVPVAGRDALMEHLAKFVPPRFAEVRDVSAEVAVITVVGPDSAEALSRLALGLRVPADALSSAPEGGYWLSGEPGIGFVVMRTAEVWPEAFSVFGPTDGVVALWKRLVESGAVPAGLGVWSTLRVEAGRPVFGTDMDEGTIPIEAGIHDRAIDYQKGCYTGQEVIIRIRDRGHVNRHLRQLELGEMPTPPAGTELFAPDDAEKVVGRVTSAVQSPKYGGVLALAYVRRGVGTVMLDGASITVPTD